MPSGAEERVPPEAADKGVCVPTGADEGAVSESESEQLPREVSLEDDTLLDKVSFRVPQSTAKLSGLQQAVLLGTWYLVPIVWL